MRKLPPPLRLSGALLAYLLGPASLHAAAPAAGLPSSFPDRLLQGARREVERGVTYDAGYVNLPYPAGDVPWSVGACTDLVTRAFRHAGIDLQQEVYEDRVAHPGAYPKNPPGEKDPNPDIDHRRCRHLVVWFRRHAKELPTAVSPQDMKEWKPGDVVFFKFNAGDSYPGHVGIVSDIETWESLPFIVDNFPPFAAERFSVTSFPVIDSHFRWPEAKARAPVVPRYASGGEPPARPAPAPKPAASPIAPPTPAATPRRIAVPTAAARAIQGRAPAPGRTPTRPQGGEWGKKDRGTSSTLSIEEPGPLAIFLTPDGRPVSLPANPLLDKM